MSVICLKCGRVKTPAPATPTPSKPTWVMPDGTTDWNKYWSSMPASIRDALGLDENLQRRRPPDNRIAPPMRLSERLAKRRDIALVTADGPQSDPKAIAAPRRLSALFAEKS